MIKFLIVLFLLITSLSQATTIVYYIDNKNIWIGADSKSRTYKGSGAFCKIFQANKNSYFVVAGYPYNKDANYNVLNMARYCLLAQGDIKMQIQTFMDSIDPQCKRLLNKFSAEFVGRIGIFTILFCGINDSISYAIEVSYKTNYRDTIQPFKKEIRYIYYCSTAVDSSSYGHFGIDKPIEEYIKNNGNPFSKSNSIPKTITKLINLSIEYSPENVAKPINILHVRKNKYKWYSNKQVCKF